MMVPNQNFPLIHGNVMAMSFPSPSILHHRFSCCAAMHESPCIYRVFDEFQDLIIDGKTPTDLLSCPIIRKMRQRNLFLSIPEQSLPGTSQFPELGKHTADGFLDLAISHHFHLVVFRPHITHRDVPKDFAPSNHFP